VNNRQEKRLLLTSRRFVVL